MKDEYQQSKYVEDIERCKSLEKSLRDRINQEGIPRRQLAHRFAEITGLAETTAYNFIKINPNFEYPLREKPPEKAHAIVKVKFSDKGMVITPEQKAHLEELAIQYALTNRQTSK